MKFTKKDKVQKVSDIEDIRATLQGGEILQSRPITNFWKRKTLPHVRHMGL